MCVVIFVHECLKTFLNYSCNVVVVVPLRHDFFGLSASQFVVFRN
jgi:hypothetical protein